MLTVFFLPPSFSLGLIAFSAIPELSQKIKTFFALAPVISLRYATSLPFELGVFLPEYSSKVLVNHYFMTDEIKKCKANGSLKVTSTINP